MAGKNGAGALSLPMQRIMVKQCKLATPGQRLTYWALLQHANPSGQSCPGNPTLAAYGGCSECQITNNLNAIEKLRLAKRGGLVRHRNGDGAFYTARAWDVKMPKTAAPKPKKAAPQSAEEKPTRVDKVAKPTPKRAKPCPHPGANHETTGACNQYDYRVRKGEITTAAPAPAPEPATEAELQAKAGAKAEREKRQAEHQKERKEREAEAQRIENAQHEDLCLYDLSEDHMTLEDCKRMYPSMYNKDGSMK